MKNIIYVLVALISLSFLTISCDKDDNSDRTVSVTATVYHKHVDFTIWPGNTIVKGIQIKETNSSEWTVLSGIESFDYVEDYEYQVKLKKTYLANPPQDGSSIIYELDAIIAKTPKS
jgi:hypothetical protein